jgi:hypothetical protein
MGYSKGNWEVVKDRVFKGNLTVQTEEIDICDIEEAGDETIYNAKLIAAAPELLEALKEIKSTLESPKLIDAGNLRRITNSAISKATE